MPQPKAKPVMIRSKPGIARDGTQFDRDEYIDALWCRWQRGLPRKIGGFRIVTGTTFAEKIYGMHAYSANGSQYLHLGSASALQQGILDQFGNLVTQTVRTPAGFAASADNAWQFDILFDDVGANDNTLIAHAAPNLSSIDSTVEQPIYIGQVDGAGVLTTSSMDPQSGGVVVLAPYLLTYGNAGRVDISPAADPAGVPVNTAFVTGSKIVRGLPMRGGGQGPAGIFWSLDSVIRGQFTDPTTGYFAFDTITSQSSILSSRCPIDYGGVYYWLGVDRPMSFNGVVQDMPNDYNVNWFYDNLNFAQRQKVFSFKVPRFGEIWWCFPFGSATECTHALILNTHEQCWYDTELPVSIQAGLGRTDGFYAQVYSKPFMVDQYSDGTTYGLWQHETGVDSINSSDIQPIRSYFQTSEISMLEGQDPVDQALHVGLVEPDFVQAGDLKLQVVGRQNARAQEVSSASFTIPAVASTTAQENVPLKEVRRLMSFKFESNTTGGDYQMGKTLAHIAPADGRQRS